MKFYIVLLAVTVFLAGFCPDLLADGDKSKASAKDQESNGATKDSEAWFVVEVNGVFDERSVKIASREELKVINEDVSKKNRSMDLAYRRSSEKWAAAERERVGEDNSKKGEKNSKKKDKPEEPKRPFVLKSPGLISVKVNGPFEARAAADKDAAEREAAIQKDSAFAAKSDEQRRAMMSKQMLADYEAVKALEGKQKELFLAELGSLNGLSSMEGGKVKLKPIGIDNKPLVRNIHSIEKPPPSAATATKVNPATVTK